MPSAAVEVVFRERLTSIWNPVDGVILDAAGTSKAPDDGSAFLIIQYPVVDAIRPTLTKRRFEEGVARIIYNVPSSTFLSTSLPKADVIAAAFRGDRLKINQVEIFEPSPPIVNDDIDDGNYYELAVNIPYRFQFDIP